MLATLTAERFLYQDVAVHRIEQRFGTAFVYDNSSGNRAIARGVLAEFKELTPDNVVWDRSERAWRFREQYDAPGRRAE
jgi:hypothetical protein